MNQFYSRPVLWTIAGSDCSGGAGIQADIKTAHTLGMEVCSLITANTVQNSIQLFSINSVEVDTLEQQFDALLSDKAPAAIKIGMLADNRQLQWLIGRLRQFAPPNKPIIVWDPVIKASVGGDLSQEALDVSLLQQLIELVDLITPNWSEAQYLSAIDQKNPERCWQSLQQLGAQALIISGGHGDDKDVVIDHCFFAEQHLQLQSAKAQTAYGHGSGCTLSTALTCFLAQGYLLRDAFIHSQAFINKAFSLCPESSDYYGSLIQPNWPVEKNFYPKVINPKAENLPAFARLEQQDIGLYPVVDSVEWLEKLMPLGIKIIQLRLKNKTSAELKQAIQQAVQLSKAYPQCQLFINDYWQLAIEYGAFGVHLGQEDLQALSRDELHKIQQSIRLGVSTHGAYEFILAQQIQPSYLAIGAIFPTQTKDMTGQIQGIENLRHLMTLRDHKRDQQQLPVVAIGGISLQRAASVKQTGVDSIAVVTAITKPDDFKKAVTDFQQLLTVK